MTQQEVDEETSSTSLQEAITRRRLRSVERASTVPRTTSESIARFEKLSLADAHRLIKERISFIVTDLPKLDFGKIDALRSKLIPIYKDNAQAQLGADGRMKMDLMTIGEFMESSEVLYGYDINVAKVLPSLLEDLPIPRYFAHCLLHQTRMSHQWKRAWPTIFFGKATTRSSLHIDQFHGHFWMTLISGAKRWQIWDEEDIALLNPTWKTDRLDPLLSESGHLPRWEDVVAGGETLFVPGGAPHRVINETDSVAIAANFVDNTNIDQVLEDLALLTEIDPAYGVLHDALDEIEVDPPWSSRTPLAPEHAVVHFSDLREVSSWRTLAPLVPF